MQKGGNWEARRPRPVQNLCQGGRVIYKPPTEQTTAIIENKPAILKITPRIHFSAIVHLPIFFCGSGYSNQSWLKVEDCVLVKIILSVEYEMIYEYNVSQNWSVHYLPRQ